MGSQHQNQPPKVVIVKHYQSPAREFAAWAKMIVFAGAVFLILAVGAFRLLTPDRGNVDPKPSKSQTSGLHSKYPECDQYRPNSAARIFCEDNAANRQKQKDWDDYRKKHP